MKHMLLTRDVGNLLLCADRYGLVLLVELEQVSL